MGVQIDFLPVGEGTKSGDAIAIRYGNLFGTRDQQTVVVVDGGFKADGEALVQHIRRHYGTDRVDLVVSTHPDQDHISGLTVVLDEMDVGELWMHRPWQHSALVASSRAGSFSALQVPEGVKASLEQASDLESLALAKGIPIREPFYGLRTSDGALIVLGPSEELYDGQLTEAEEGKTASTSIIDLLRRIAGRLVPETMLTETLTDEGGTSALNNTCAVLLLQDEGRRYLFTGDAGIPALEPVADVLEYNDLGGGVIEFVQIPHHGSRRNVGPTVLDRLLGPKGQTAGQRTAFVSACKGGSDKHPSKKVTNAFLRRGCAVHSTQGDAKLHHHNAPERPGWNAATPLPLYDEVEE